jgi:hypothetical protein
MLLMVQHISVEWTKASRGGKGAALRNAVPEALPLKDIPATNDPLALIYHHASFLQNDKFQNPHIKIKAEVIMSEQWLDLPCTRIHIAGEQVLVRYSFNSGTGGAPRRDDFPRDFTLMVSEWIRIKFNGRFREWEGAWYYRKTVLNIGLFEKIARNAFLGEPTRIFNDMAIMW